MGNGFNNEYTYMELIYQLLKRWRKWLIYCVVCSLLLIAVKIPALNRVVIYSGFVKAGLRIVKYVVYGVLFGTVVQTVVYLFRYSDRIVSERYIRDSFEIELLGTLPETVPQYDAYFDRLLKKAFGIKRRRKEITSEQSAIMKDLSQHVLLKEMDHECTIAVVSSCGQEIAENFLEQVRDYEHPLFRFIQTGNVIDDGEELQKVLDADLVLIVEQQEISTYSELKFLVNKLTSWEKEIVGIVLMGVDAI